MANNNNKIFCGNCVDRTFSLWLLIYVVVARCYSRLCILPSSTRRTPPAYTNIYILKHEMANQSHAQWTIFANALINSGKHFDVNTCRITDEMSAINLCQKSKLRCAKTVFVISPIVRRSFWPFPLILNCISRSNCINKWLKKLNQPRQRSSKLADFYRKEGIIHCIGECTDNDLAADYHTKAIYSAPKDSAELALAHLNRAKCLVKTEGFIEVSVARTFSHDPGILFITSTAM